MYDWGTAFVTCEFQEAYVGLGETMFNGGARARWHRFAPCNLVILRSLLPRDRGQLCVFDSPAREGLELRGGMQPGEKSINAVNITGV